MACDSLPPAPSSSYAVWGSGALRKAGGRASLTPGRPGRPAAGLLGSAPLEGRQAEAADWLRSPALCAPRSPDALRQPRSPRPAVPCASAWVEGVLPGPGRPPTPAVTPRPVPVLRGAAGEPSRGQAPAQGCPPRPLCSTPAGPAATSGAAAALVAPAAGAAAIFVGPAATGFSVAHGACAAALRPSACVLSACATPPPDTMATLPTLGPTVPSLVFTPLLRTMSLKCRSRHLILWPTGCGSDSRSLAPRFAALMLPRELQGGSGGRASPQGRAGCCCSQPPMRTTGHQRKQLLLMSYLQNQRSMDPLSATRCPSRTSHCSTWGGDISDLWVFQSPRLSLPCVALYIRSNTVGFSPSNACCGYLITVVGERVCGKH